MTQTEIGEWLALRREDAGLTQMQAASQIGRDSGLLSKWERGELRMSAESFLDLVRLYKAQKELIVFLANFEKVTRSAGAGGGEAGGGKRRAG